MKGRLAQLRAREQHLLDQLRQRGPIACTVNAEQDQRAKFGDSVGDRVVALIGRWRFNIVRYSLYSSWIIQSSVSDY